MTAGFVFCAFQTAFAQTEKPVDYQELGWTPDGKQISFTSLRDNNWDVYLMNADGSSLTRLTDNAANDSYPSWSPDGQRLAFGSNRSGKFQIYFANRDGSDQRQITNDSEGENAFPTWSPDGKKIAFMSKNGEYWQIYVMNQDGSHRKRITVNNGNNYNPSWSPGGSRLVFESDRDGHDADEIYTIGANGKHERRITTNNLQGVNDVFPTWISKNKISCSSVKDRKVDILVMSATGADPKLLISGAFYGRWSPDKSRIAYISQGNKNAGPQIFVMNADGSNLTQLTK
jgi:Tol biopolymer transport system component